jgi:hypothetical protein
MQIGHILQLDSADVRTQIHWPMGNFRKATLFYFQLTFPGSSTVTLYTGTTPPYQGSQQNSTLNSGFVYENCVDFHSFTSE